MISEIATFRIKEGHGQAFESAAERAAPLFQQARGALSFRLERTVEDHHEYTLIVGWTNVEAHTDEFRNSNAFGRWRALVSEHFESSPEVKHTTHIVTGF